MSFLFGGKKKTPEELMREYKRSIDKSVREIERERTKLQTQEKKIITDIKKAAKEGQMGPVKIMAKDLVRTRGQITKFYSMKCQMQAVGLRLQSIKSTQAMTDAMKGAARAMKSMNSAVDVKSMAKILGEFEKESALMDDKQEMMDDAIDDAFEAEDEEGAINDVVGQVLAEIGIDLGGQMVGAPGAQPVAAAATAEAEGELSLEERLKNLKG
uniref:Uncharacterized protein n=1 Tax=Hemiselmis andersenii TaxID=464988 RepID=A0A6T8P7B5_HEMAN|mmetsp:Transcript_2941/g.6688  ORF Transcript_2941/g.6688 Transcript_2941/m.6688 type:complete len:213 (+) Transcript_2941:243-881(+)|eukprot:CAMPEP_0114128736 /NCGR_PEP_ID=MMETSP0043_2-20121206/11096_1 /TAXON_ID=464988 /ORGANISM="Hemiselmis andersenii, Strain CCMP644" /LENGTH=212 /DNA_ID=CAMNT_0001221955 /DNA_START=679 /DNA_END=1317 /DNA_ORIENTATION=+